MINSLRKKRGKRKMGRNIKGVRDKSKGGRDALGKNVL